MRILIKNLFLFNTSIFNFSRGNLRSQIFLTCSDLTWLCQSVLITLYRRLFVWKFLSGYSGGKTDSQVAGQPVMYCISNWTVVNIRNFDGASRHRAYQDRVGLHRAKTNNIYRTDYLDWNWNKKNWLTARKFKIHILNFLDWQCNYVILICDNYLTPVMTRVAVCLVFSVWLLGWKDRAKLQALHFHLHCAWRLKVKVWTDK